MGNLLRFCAGVVVVVASGCTTPRGISNNSPTVGGIGGVRQAAIDKIDLLFMIDNSASMGDKQLLLSLAVPDLLGRLLAPNCVDASDNSVAVSAGGTCADGTKIEFPPVHDMHIGIGAEPLSR